MTNHKEQFYSDLRVNKASLPELLAKENLFSPIPSDWHVIITDITGSTQAVMNGQHEDVNLIATGSIVTVLNIAYGSDITVPFFFGGDGATFLVPASLIDKLMHALTLYKANTLSNFNLEIRAGTIAVAHIYSQGHEIKIAKFSSSASFAIPIVLGNGLNYAEQLIKAKDYQFSDDVILDEKLDLSGMQCRWDKIAPPENKEEIVTLLVIAVNDMSQSVVFMKVLKKMDQLYGSLEKRQPISVSKLKLKTTFGRLGTEMRARLNKIKWIELLKTWFIALYGRFYFRTKDGQNYLKKLVEMSDTLVVDGKINTVISGSTAQRAALQELLEQMETNGEIIYGIHISGASIMSCYVRNLENSHVHFVDGAEGGYTKAAGMLKAKLNSKA